MMEDTKLVTVIVRMGNTVHHMDPEGVKTKAGPGESIALPADEAARLLKIGTVVPEDDPAAAFHQGLGVGLVFEAPPEDPKPKEPKEYTVQKLIHFARNV